MSYASFQEQYASGTAGLTPATGFNQSMLNTTVANTVGATLASGQVTLQPGKYWIEGIANTNGKRAQTALWDFTNNVALLNGVNAGGFLAGPGYASNANSQVSGPITLLSPTAVGLNIFVESGGVAPDPVTSGQPEVYAQLTIIQF
jgi:hypothetical protein